MTPRRCAECGSIHGELAGARRHYGRQHGTPIPPAEEFPTVGFDGGGSGDRAGGQRDELTGTPDKR